MEKEDNIKKKIIFLRHGKTKNEHLIKDEFILLPLFFKVSDKLSANLGEQISKIKIIDIENREKILVSLL